MAEERVRHLGYTRDPSGFVFWHEGLLFRQINNVYKEDYECLLSSGLYQALVDKELLIAHEEADTKLAKDAQAYKVIKPQYLPFVSYPYEWCFSQLKDAALVTLKIQKMALEFGMSLKDASAYNIQFKNGRPVLIDTLSFERYRQGYPWVAYRQFCQQFLAPLALMSYIDARLNQLLRVYMDGVPLDLASAALPFRSYLRLPLLSHIHFHARSQEYFARKNMRAGYRKMPRLGLDALIDNLEYALRGLKEKFKSASWEGYYEDTNYSAQAFAHKKQIVERFLDKINPGCLWDLGANTGLFSRIASARGIETVSFDFDPLVVERSYRRCLKDRESHLLPLVMDLTNPSPAVGWRNQERMSLLERGPVEMVFALALIHHLAISHNLPFEEVAAFLSEICNYLVIEFVPKSDSQVEKMLSVRDDIFSGYSQKEFESAFNQYFVIEDMAQLEDSGRVLYLMRKNG